MHVNAVSLHRGNSNKEVYVLYTPIVKGGGNLALLSQRRFLTAPYPLLNSGMESLTKEICSNDGILHRLVQNKGQ